MRLYSLPIRTGTSGTYYEGRDKWLRDNYKFRDVNTIVKTVKFDKKSSADPGSRKL